MLTHLRSAACAVTITWNYPPPVHLLRFDEMPESSMYWRRALMHLDHGQSCPRPTRQSVTSEEDLVSEQQGSN
ncbi:hypothetical protein OG21DRAFT_1512966 [Imleria badia]|nr:hypothetical protein OG21DRAFT_1512966 [Imleria badia]